MGKGRYGEDEGVLTKDLVPVESLLRCHFIKEFTELFQPCQLPSLNIAVLCVTTGRVASRARKTSLDTQPTQLKLTFGCV